MAKRSVAFLLHLALWQFGPLEIWTLPVAVNRCICKQVPFTALKSLADSGIRTIEELSRLTHCGTGCGMCIPYIRVMLATGQTDLPVMSEEDFRRFAFQPSPPKPQPLPLDDRTQGKDHP